MNARALFDHPHASSPHALAFSSDARAFACAIYHPRAERRIACFDLDIDVDVDAVVSPRFQIALGADALSVGALAFSPEGAYLACGDDDGISIVDARSGELIARAPLRGVRVGGLHWRSDGRVLRAHSGNEVFFWDVSARTLSVLGVPGVIARAVFGDDTLIVERPWNAEAPACFAIDLDSRQQLHDFGGAPRGLTPLAVVGDRVVSWDATSRAGIALAIHGRASGAALERVLIAPNSPLTMPRGIAVSSSSHGRFLACTHGDTDDNHAPYYDLVVRIFDLDSAALVRTVACELRVPA
ncbi:MAG TPA: hypothetical protein VGO62_10235, partial [Myxococcota bacterium]